MSLSFWSDKTYSVYQQMMTSGRKNIQINNHLSIMQLKSLSGIMGNPLWAFLWLIILIFMSFFVAGFCAGWYILLYPLTVCIPALTVRLILAVIASLILMIHFSISGSHKLSPEGGSVSSLLCSRDDGLQADVLSYDKDCVLGSFVDLVESRTDGQ